MQITINGEKREYAKSLTIAEILKNLELPTERVAVELNKELVRKKDWDAVSLKDADKIEIVHFVGGG